jgi:hypothetical protein
LRPSRHSLLPLGPGPESPPFVLKTTRFSSCSTSVLVSPLLPSLSPVFFYLWPLSHLYLFPLSNGAVPALRHVQPSHGLHRAPINVSVLCAVSQHIAPCRFSSAGARKHALHRATASLVRTRLCAALALRLATVLLEVRPSWRQPPASSASACRTNLLTRFTP